MQSGQEQDACGSNIWGWDQDSAVADASRRAPHTMAAGQQHTGTALRRTPPPPRAVYVRRYVDGCPADARGPPARLDPVALHGGNQAQRGVGHAVHLAPKV